MHPNGDEIVILLSGNVTFVLQLDSGEKRISLFESGSFALVPKSVWHTAKTNEKTKLLFITPGEGTQNRAI
jgi:mannose-6-phosphate isomerase-like protein (cupin superfamily)